MRIQHGIERARHFICGRVPIRERRRCAPDDFFQLGRNRVGDRGGQCSDLRVVRRVREETQRQSIRVELSHVAIALDERWRVSGADVVNQSKLLVETAKKCRGRAPPA